MPLDTCVCLFLLRGSTSGCAFDPVTAGKGHTEEKPDLFCHLLVGVIQETSLTKCHTARPEREKSGCVYMLKEKENHVSRVRKASTSLNLLHASMLRANP